MEGRDMQAQGGPDHQSYSLMEQEAAPSSDMKVESVTFRPAANGGVIATCSKRRADGKMDAPNAYESKDYAFSSIEEAQAYLASELGGADGSVARAQTEPAGGPMGRM